MFKSRYYLSLLLSFAGVFFAPTLADSPHGATAADFDKVKKSILKNFDYRCVSNPQCRIGIRVSYKSDGTPICTKEYSEGSTPSDYFYAEQAVWDTVVLPESAPPDYGYEFTGTYMPSYGEHPELLKNKSKNFVTLHLVPMNFPSSEILPPSEINGPANILRLSTKKLNDPRLAAFRTDCLAFGRPPFAERLSRAEALRKKYSDLFE
jgi:hypothetical protein